MPSSHPPAPGQRISVPLSSAHAEAIDIWIARQPDPKPSRAEAVRKLSEMGLAADRAARAKAKSDAADARRVEGRQATAEYEKARAAEDEKTERLRRVRLAKEAHEKRIASGEQAPARRIARPLDSASPMAPAALTRADYEAAKAERAARIARAKAFAESKDEKRTAAHPSKSTKKTPKAKAR